MIYADNAATTQTRPEVMEAMWSIMGTNYGNPSSLHQAGRQACKLLAKARKVCAGLINCRPSEIIFTSSGTESNNLALRGVLQNAKKIASGKNHFISVSTEHSAVLQPLKHIESEGNPVTLLPVDKQGLISLKDLAHSFRPETLMVSVMHANNEIGVIQDLAAISALCKEHGVLLHTDAVQSAGKIPIDVQALGIDLLSVSGHKLYGPKGIGFLFKRQALMLEPILYGGSQEIGLKPGTENLPGIIGLSKAIECRLTEMEEEIFKLRVWQQKIIDEVLKIPGVILNGPFDLNKRVPGNLNFSFETISGDILVLQLDLQNICVSSGAACSEGNIEPSHVIKSLYPEGQAHYALNSVRISLGHFNQSEEIPQISKALQKIALTKSS